MTNCMPWFALHRSSMTKKLHHDDRATTGAVTVGSKAGARLLWGGLAVTAGIRETSEPS